MAEHENKATETQRATSAPENLLDDFGAARSRPTESVPVTPPPQKAEPAEKPAPKESAPAKAPAKKPASQSKAPAKKPTAKKSAGSSPSSGSKQAKVKNQNAKEDKDPNRVQASTATAKKAKSGKPDYTDPAELRSSKIGHRVVPYILVLLAIFIGISLLLNLFCNLDNQLKENPSEHLMGVFGYYVCYGLLGVFGPAVFVLPLLLVNLAIFWKKYVDNSMVISKILVSAVFLLIFSAVIHSFCLSAYMSETGLSLADCNWTAGELMDIGADPSGGGVLGGKLGYMMVKYLNVIGSLLVGFLLLFASLLYILGVTPRQIWRFFRKNSAANAARRAEKRELQRSTSRSELEAEDAHLQAQMDEKIRRITAKDGTTDTANGAVEVVRPAPQKKSEEDKMAPMPMPRLDPTDGSRPFVPGDIGRQMNEANRASQQNAQAQQTRQAPPTPAPINPAQNRDTAVDPIFPKSNEAKLVRRVPRQDRNFDLNKVFLDLGDSENTTERKHAPVPPEVPLRSARGAARVAPQEAPGQAATAPSGQTKTAASTQQKPMPATQSHPKAATAPGTQPRQAATPQKNAQATPAAKGPAPSLSAVKPTPTPAGNASGQPKPIFRHAESQQTEFGLSNEQFEQLEAQKGALGGVKSAAGAIKAADAKRSAGTAKQPDAKKKSDDKKAETPKTPAKPPINKKYVFPPISYLQPGEPMTAENRAEIEENMMQLSETLASFHVRVQEINYSCGPTVTRYEVVLAPGVRVRSVTNLADDIALALRSPGGVRIEAPIPGTNAVGIEIPNKTRSTIYLRDMIESKKFMESTSKLSACLGADIAGAPLIFDIAKMPHLLVAGTTGSGKSVCINCIITSLLYRVRPDEVKLILIDPKKVEFSIYKNIPHLMAPVVTLPKDAAGALQAAVEEMERRFEIFETVGVRDLKGYNNATKDDPDMPTLPHIVIIIDELADLMMTARNEVETAICRIAQKARAAGMHLIIGTQRPSADVVTGLIKANVPSCIAFAVKSQIDSRVILDHGGAEALTGRGDMLFVPIGSMRDTRVQGAFVDDKEVEKICEFLRATNGTAVYDDRFIAKLKELAAQCGNKGKNADDIPPVDGEDHGDDPKYNDAVRVAVEEGRISTSLLQRKLGVGYSRAAKLIDRMQAEEIVSPPDGSKPRSILITPEQYLERFVDNAKEDGDSDPEA